MPSRVLVLAFACAGLLLGRVAPSAVGASGTAEHGILFVYRPHIAGWLGGDIYNLTPGRFVHRLIHSGKANFDPQWSPRGNEIAYTALKTNGLMSCGPCTQEVWVARADGSHPHRLTSVVGSEAATTDVHPSWSPTGSRLVFERDFAVPPLHRLLIVPARGGRETGLGVPGTNPAWRRPGIAYAVGKSIRLIRPGTRRATLFAQAHANVTGLAWSKSAELGALVGDYGRQIAIFAATGRQVVSFTLPRPLFLAGGLTWSPDGKHLLLAASVRGGQSGLYETDTHGMHLRHIVSRVNACCASWR